MASFFELDLDNHLGSDGHLMKIDKLLKMLSFFEDIEGRSLRFRS